MKYSSQGMCAVFCHYNAKKKSFKPCLHSATHFCKLPQRPTEPQPALQAGGSHRVTRHIGFRNEKWIEKDVLGVPPLRGVGLSRHETVALPHGFPA